jgi:hypothetical protein
MLAAGNPGFNPSSLLSALAFDPAAAAAAAGQTALATSAPPPPVAHASALATEIPQPVSTAAGKMALNHQQAFGAAGYNSAAAAATVLMGNANASLPTSRVQSGSLSRLSAACAASGASASGARPGPTSPSLPPGGGAVRVPPFLTKLYTIMQDASPDDCAGWCTDGTAFRITDPQRFADRCLPRFFKHNKLGSFQQQLLTYGFSRVPNESCLDISAIWQHPKFQAGRPEMLEQITRATAKGKVEKEVLKKDGGEVQEEEEEQRDDADELMSMQTHLGKLTYAVSDMHQELRAARAYEMRILEQLVARVDRKLPRRNPEPLRPDAAAAAPVEVQAVAVAEPPAAGAQPQA